ncbi:hypothetical protein HMPREF3207_00005 [Citrobacter koseri]|nr:hypothetical protein HMPREF3207_00005 [Citrobacter koseri]
MTRFGKPISLLRNLQNQILKTNINHAIEHRVWKSLNSVHTV